MAPRRLTPEGPGSANPIRESIVERLAGEAIRSGAEFLEVEYEDGYENVVAGKGHMGVGIARFRSSSPEAITLREELHSLAERKRRIIVDGSAYELWGKVYESFGEDAFRVRLRRA